MRTSQSSFATLATLDERGFGEVELASDHLHVVARQPACLENHGELVAGAPLGGKDVDDAVFHGTEPPWS